MRDQPVSDIEEKAKKDIDQAIDPFFWVAIPFILLLVQGVMGSMYNTAKEEELKLKTERGYVLLQERNVIGDETPDKFYEIDGKRVYLEIDGKPVEEYFGR